MIKVWSVCFFPSFALLQWCSAFFRARLRRNAVKKRALCSIMQTFVFLCAIKAEERRVMAQVMDLDDWCCYVICCTFREKRRSQNLKYLSLSSCRPAWLCQCAFQNIAVLLRARHQTWTALGDNRNRAWTWGLNCLVIGVPGRYQSHPGSPSTRSGSREVVRLYWTGPRFVFGKIRSAKSTHGNKCGPGPGFWIVCIWKWILIHFLQS